MSLFVFTACSMDDDIVTIDVKETQIETSNDSLDVEGCDNYIEGALDGNRLRAEPQSPSIRVKA